MEEITEQHKPQVFNFTDDELDEVHELTEGMFFKDDGNGKACKKALSGNHIYGVDKFTKLFPEIDMSKYKQVDYVQPEEDTI